MLEYINDPNDIKQIQPEDYKLLAKDIRRFLLRNVSRTGGHLASNLGIVELTMALHLVLDFPKDQLIFDVGHQSYVHKILTGRKNGFENLRQFHGMSGFPKRKESDCDAFHSGHSSMSLSAALGMVTARDINHTDETIVAVIGDGALSGGMAYEALNNMARLRKEKKNLIIILNDNKMSISKNVGALARYLTHLRTTTAYYDAKDNVRSFLDGVPLIGTPMKKSLIGAKTLVRRAMKLGLYEGVNLSLAYCDDCGYQQLEMDVCPKCGSTNLTKIDRMNGYLSYSRVHGESRLNDAKMAEIAERKSM